MLENPSQPDPPSNSTSAPVKRYAPPNQRNRGLNRRKSGEKTSSLHGGDDKSIAAAFRSAPSDARSSNCLNESLHRRVISLNGCSRSEAGQLLHDRWEATINCYNDPEIDLSELYRLIRTKRPVMYTSSPASAWTNFRLPHQLISGQQMDFLGELHRELQTHNLNSTG
ncbi:hypothetical protein V2J09_005889 [Rumex salicifolius]